jgi:uncharacterized protein (TIGR02453 family)
MLDPKTLKFLSNLSNNNNKPWIDENRPQYLIAKENFELFISEIITLLGKKIPYLQETLAKSCTFRLNRDVRFSKNKDPYKTNMGASIKRGGKKSIYSGFYIHIENNNCFVGGGIWMPEPIHLQKIRQEIDYNFSEFKKIVSSKTFTSAFKDGLSNNDALKNVPKGYSPENPAADFLKRKHYVALHKISDKEILEKDAAKNIVKILFALNPLIEFLNQAMED